MTFLGCPATMEEKPQLVLFRNLKITDRSTTRERQMATAGRWGKPTHSRSFKSRDVLQRRQQLEIQWSDA